MAEKRTARVVRAKLAGSDLSELLASIRAAAVAQGYDSLLHACRELKVDYQLVQRAAREGVTPKTTVKTVDSLRAVGAYELIRAAHDRVISRTF